MIESYFLKPNYPIGLSVDETTFEKYFIHSNNIEEAKRLLSSEQPVFPGTFRLFAEKESLLNRVYIDSIDSFWFGMLCALETLQEGREASFPFLYQPLDFQLKRDDDTLTILIVQGSKEFERHTFPVSSLEKLASALEHFFKDCHTIGLAIVTSEYKDISRRIKLLK
jgi:hypothetical protein